MKIALALCVAIAALFAAEGVARLVAPAYDPSGRVTFTYLPDGTPIGPANAIRRQTRNTGDYDVVVRFNALGFRDSKSLDTSTTDSIFVLGDSFAFGWGVEEWERFSDLLQVRLGRPVFNIGAGSADLDGYGHLLHYAESHGARIGTLIVSVCMENDLREYGPDEPERPTAGSVSSVKTLLADHSAVYGMIATAIHRSPGLERAVARTGLLVPNLEAIAESDASAESVSSSAERLRHLVAGRRAIVLIVPSRALWVGSDDHRLQVARTHERFVSLLRRAGLRVVDVRESFEQQQGRPPLSLHFPSDGHWTTEGHRIAAGALATAIAGR